MSKVIERWFSDFKYASAAAGDNTQSRTVDLARQRPTPDDAEFALRLRALTAMRRRVWRGDPHEEWREVQNELDIRKAAAEAVVSIERGTERPAVTAADPAHDVVLGAKAALRSAVSVRESARARFGAAEREVERIRDLVKRLEASR